MHSPVRFFWSVKGGAGTSTVAAASAIRLASDDQEVLLVDLEGDQPSLLGMIAGPEMPTPGLGEWLRLDDDKRTWDQLEGLCEEVAPGMKMLRRGNLADDADPSQIAEALARLSESRQVVVDGGLDHRGVRSEVDGHSGHAVAVTRACYLSLSRAQRIPGPYGRVVLVEEPGRSLRVRDVAAALGAEHVERIAWDPRVARSIDAGTVVGMLPPPLREFDVNFGGMGAASNFDASKLQSDASEARTGSHECGFEMASGGQCTQRVAAGATECRSGHPVRQ